MKHSGVVGGVYGLRVFSSYEGKPLSPVFHGSVWERGTSQAICRNEGAEHDSECRPPVLDCTCGLYSFSSMSALLHSLYEDEAREHVTVVSLEGEVIEHDTGYRSEKATIVAVWTPDGHCPWSAAEIPAIAVYSDLGKMLDDYGIPIKIPVKRTIRSTFYGEYLPIKSIVLATLAVILFWAVVQPVDPSSALFTTFRWVGWLVSTIGLAAMFLARAKLSYSMFVIVLGWGVSGVARGEAYSFAVTSVMSILLMSIAVTVCRVTLNSLRNGSTVRHVKECS